MLCFRDYINFFIKEKNLDAVTVAIIANYLKEIIMAQKLPIWLRIKDCGSRARVARPSKVELSLAIINK